MAEAIDIPTDPEGFLAWEFEQAERYERLDGIVRMMVGGTNAHHLLTGNLFGDLWQRLRGSGCQPFAEAARLVTPANDVLYPDVLVTCAPFSLEGTYLDQAVLVAEVLSASTEGRDRGAKWRACQTVPGLAYYLLLSQEAPCLEMYHWDDGWRYACFEGLDAIPRLERWNLELPLDRLYEGVAFTPENG